MRHERVPNGLSSGRPGLQGPSIGPMEVKERKRTIKKTKNVGQLERKEKLKPSLVPLE